jgi:bacterial/archaeal transporter family protein
LPWIALALLSAALLALSNMLDKAVVHSYVATPLTMPLMIGIAHSLLGITILAIVGLPDGATTSAILLAITSGALIGVGGLMWILVLYRQEVSRVVPVTQTAPIFAAILAVLFLGETMSTGQWLSVGATVTGAILISLKIGERYRDILIQRSFFILITAAIVLATANIIAKTAVADMSIIHTHGLRSVGLGGVFFIASLRRPAIDNVRALVAQRSPGLLLFGFNEIVIANSALLLLLGALSQGPASLVLALAGTRAMFIVVFTTTLALAWKGALGEDTTRRTLAIKASAVALIVAGIIGVSV